MKISSYLLVDRLEAGSLTGTGDTSALVFDPVPARGKADGQIAAWSVLECA